MEAKLAHKLTGMCHEPLLQVFLDVRKSYEFLDRGRCMKILRVHDLGPHLQRILQRLLGVQSVIPKAGEFFGNTFGTEIGVTQGPPFSPDIFKILVTSVVRVVLLKLCVPQEAHHRLGWATGEHIIIF